MGVGDSAGCGCQGRGPTSSILSSRAAASRGLDADATGRTGMEAARCAPGPRGDRSGGGGAGRGLQGGRAGAEARIGSPGWQAPCKSRVARALSSRSPGVFPEPARPAPPRPPIPSLAMRCASRAASTLERLPGVYPDKLSLLPRVSIPLLAMSSPFSESLSSRIRTELEEGHSWESKRKVARVMVNWFQGRCFWQSLWNSGTSPRAENAKLFFSFFFLPLSSRSSFNQDCLSLD